MKAFVVLGEVLHFGQAALRLHITQSALSKQIQRLEAEWGGALFERSAACTRFTALGRVLYPDAQRVLQDARQLSRRADDVVAGVSGVLRVGFGVASKELVPVAISTFRRERPEVRVELFDMSTHHQILAVQERMIDIAFCRMPVPEGWPCLPVTRARFVAVLPPGDDVECDLTRWAKRPLAMISRARAPAFHDHLMSYLAGVGVRIPEMQMVSDFTSAVALAAAGVAWAIVPSSTAIDQGNVRVVPLEAPEASWRIGMTRLPGEADVLVDAFWHVVEGMVS